MWFYSVVKSSNTETLGLQHTFIDAVGWKFKCWRGFNRFKIGLCFSVYYLKISTLLLILIAKSHLKPKSKSLPFGGRLTLHPLTYDGTTGMQNSLSPQKQKNKSHVPECGNETPLGQISILRKQNSPLGRLPQTRWVYPKNQPHRGKWLKKKKRLGPWGKMEKRVLEEEEEVVREGLRRVNADSSTKAATAAEGREEHGKRAKVKGTSGGFKFKATVSVCILTTAPHPRSTYTSICSNNNRTPPHHY